MKKKSVSVIFIALIIVLLLTSFVSAGLFGDIGNWFKKLFGIGDKTDLEGQLGTMKPGGTNDYGSPDYPTSDDYCTCAYFGYECGNHTICGREVNCGDCIPGYFYCAYNKCVIECEDTDITIEHPNGKNYNEKGMTTNSTTRKTDDCSSGGENFLVEYYCEDNIIKPDYYDCGEEGKTCRDGACRGETSPPPFCTETDNKIDYDEKGLVTTNEESFWDSCDNITNVLYEGFCDGYVGLIQEHDCASEGKICKYGICTEPGELGAEPPCNDTDFGKDYYTQGQVYSIIGPQAPESGEDACLTFNLQYTLTNGTHLSEVFCDINDMYENDIVLCLYGCEYGACKRDYAQIKCEDSDNGINSKIIGYVYNPLDPSSPKIYDVCMTNAFGIGEDDVKEVYCNAEGMFDTRFVICAFGCDDGACLEQEMNTTISLATLKDNYSIGEKIELTDPPDFDEEVYLDYSNDKENYETELSREDFSPQEPLKSYGYIIKFKDKPILEKKSELEKQAKKNEKYIKDHPILSTITTYRFRAFTSKNVGEEIDDYSKDLEKNNQVTKEKVRSKTEKKIKREFTKVFNGIALDISSEEAEELKQLEEVGGVYPDLIVEETLMNSTSWIGATDAWKLDKDLNDCSVSGQPCLTGEGITIAIIDTGIDYTHQDLGSCTEQEFLSGNCEKVIGGWDFVLCEEFGPEGCVSGNEKEEDANPIDEKGHGTHCAGIAAGKGDYNENGILEPGDGLNGVAPDAKLYSYRVLNRQGSGSASWIIAGIEAAADPNNDSNFSDHVDIMSLSLGAFCGPWGYTVGCGPDDPVSLAVDNIVNNGVVAIIAAGNDGHWGDESIGSPGTARKAITIGATEILYRYNRSDIARFSSQGPVTWVDAEGNNQYLVKPDILAPGDVFVLDGDGICSAQYNEAWAEYECFDTKHTAIYGTSMATPHAAGAAALLLQKNYNYTPDDIKHILRNTGESATIKFIDKPRINDSIFKQGFGKMRVLNALENSDKIPLALINISGKVPSGLTDIYGIALGENFESYALDYIGYDDYVDTIKNFDAPVFTELTSSTTPTEDILDTIDTSLMNDDVFILRLKVWGNNLGARDYSMVEINNLELLSVGDNFNYLDGVETIRGRVDVASYDSYKVEYQPMIFMYDEPSYYSEENWTELCTGTEVIGDVLCNYDFSNLNDGTYVFRLAVLKSGIWIHDTELVMGGVAGGLMNNFCNYIDLPPLLFPFVTDIDNDGEKEVVQPFYDGCVYPACSERSLIFIEKDGSYVKKELGSDSIFVSPAIYKDYPENLIFLASRYDLTKENRIIDSNLNVKYTLPNVNEPYSMTYIDQILFDINNDGEDEIFITTSENEEIKIYGFYKNGQQLTNFPINIQKELNNYSVPTLRIGFLKKGEEYVLAVPVVEYEPVFVGEVWEGDYITRSYVDFYSTSGIRLSRNYLFNDNSTSIVLYISFFPTGDLNGDGDSELVMTYNVRYTDLYNADHRDVNAYESFIKVIDSDGNTVSEYSFNGYNTYLSIIADLGYENPSIISRVDYTIATSDLGDKILVTNYLGEVLLDLPLPSNNIYDLLVGDIDDDYEQEIVVSSTRYSENGYVLDILILNRYGVIENTYTIPLLDNGLFYITVADINGDGKTDLLIELRDVEEDNFYSSKIIAFELGSDYHPERISWPRFSHDNQHTSMYGRETIEPPISRPQSKIVNNENSALTGQLTMTLQKWVINTWQDEQVVINQKIIIPAKGLLKLDIGKDNLGNQVFAGWNNLNISADSVGNYQVYVRFESYMDFIQTRWEFEVV